MPSLASQSFLETIAVIGVVGWCEIDLADVRMESANPCLVHIS